MKKTILSPISVLLGIIGIITLIAGTDLFTPLVKFVHSESVTPIEAFACLIFTVFGFAACYYFLNTLCTYFVPRLEANNKKKQRTINCAQK